MQRDVLTRNYGLRAHLWLKQTRPASTEIRGLRHCSSRPLTTFPKADVVPHSAVCGRLATAATKRRQTAAQSCCYDTYLSQKTVTCRSVFWSSLLCVVFICPVMQWFAARGSYAAHGCVLFGRRTFSLTLCSPAWQRQSPDVWKHDLLMSSVFGSNYRCEQLTGKSRTRTRLNDEHLEGCLPIATTEIKPILKDY
jgi:hypothetical protein